MILKDKSNKVVFVLQIYGQSIYDFPYKESYLAKVFFENQIRFALITKTEAVVVYSLPTKFRAIEPLLKTNESQT